MKWINVKDRMPTEYGIYLVLLDGKIPKLIECIIDYGVYNLNFSPCFMFNIPSEWKNVTHWIPLPKIPNDR